MEINYSPTLIKGINQTNFKKNQINSTPTPQRSNSSNNSEKAFSVTISNEAKIISNQNYRINPDFPPDYAPQAVKDAWRLVTSKLEPKLAAIATRAPFKAAQLAANTTFDSNGIPTVKQKGDEGYVDIYSQPDFTYRGFIDQALKNLEMGARDKSNEYHIGIKQFLNDLDQTFAANGVV